MLRLVAWLAVVPTSVRGAYFWVEEGRERCFTENILMHQVLRMTYTMHEKEVLSEAPAGSTRSHCKIIVKNPKAEVVKEHAVLSDNHQDALALVAQVEGAHSICLTCASEDWLNFNPRKMRWSIAFDLVGASGPGMPDPTRLASLSHMKGAQASVEELLARLAAISTENEYEKTFEAQFVRASDAVNTDVAAFKVLQILLVFGVTAFQIHHLSRFLRRSHLLDCCLPMAMRQKPMV